MPDTTRDVVASEPVEATFVARPNRFVVRALLPDGEVVDAHLPNTARLTHLTVPGRPLILRPSADPSRKTAFTATRAWDGCWVGLEAAKAPGLLAAWLEQGNPLPRFGTVGRVEREVPIDGNRIDLRVRAGGRRVWVEVKSSGRVVKGVALLSQTPSRRGATHLAKLAALSASGVPAAVVFVIQRPDAAALRIGGDADEGWVRAVTGAARAGVEILAFGCDVSISATSIREPLPVAWDHR